MMRNTASKSMAFSVRVTIPTASVFWPAISWEITPETVFQEEDASPPMAVVVLLMAPAGRLRR